VPYLIEYIDIYTLDCLFGLGHFSTPDSCKTLLKYINDEDEFNRRFSVQSLGKLDFTVSDEMWELRENVLNSLHERLLKEKEEWILPFLNEAFTAVDVQIYPNLEDGQMDG